MRIGDVPSPGLVRLNGWYYEVDHGVVISPHSHPPQPGAGVVIIRRGAGPRPGINQADPAVSPPQLRE